MTISQTGLSISYSVGVKANLGNYESADVHFSRSETWDVANATDEEVEVLYAERFVALKEQLDEEIESGYAEMKK